ncbi:RNA polymerase, sigma-24 subunit, RpoE [Anaerovirgula multivorans]|uniref:RNA polymerase, sigma-24 subunit, RpoE n=1 Tax=Anaerovirgula multivorans TaxID=312168 RepID=A0A239HVG8_9FIRM|nr:sigma-70 family RNA polymerase sigma factor [Anaerovirgula multivorans]SNS85231.1 RNA polymerase, sigma-24 subunit, RpoE [Anaerovirgula multivorans]
MSLLQHQEAVLIEKAKTGDVESFELLIASYQKRAFNIAYRMLGNLEDANDITQEALVKVYRSIHNFKGNSSFSTWLYSIVNNVCIDFIRKNKKAKLLYIDKQQDGESYQREIPDEINTPECLFEKNEIKRMVHDAINQLNYEQRNIIILRDIQGFSYQEIAEMINVSVGTVKSRISRARSNLKEIISENYKVTS